jgi:hypothetical protein
MEAKHRENLLKLARYLWDLPEDYTHFDMETFFDGPDPIGHCPPQNAQRPGGCGTVACALGHGPAAGVKPSDNVAGWYSYSLEAFGLPGHSTEWLWCFSDTWRQKDNTPRGAAKRIFYMLERRSPRSGWTPDIYADQKRL